MILDDCGAGLVVWRRRLRNQFDKKIIARSRVKSVISTYECSQFRTEFAADSPLEESRCEPSSA
jgi:hypothetical protein